MGNLSRSPKIFVSRQLKNFNNANFLQNLERFYWDDLVDLDDPTIAAQFWTRVFVGLLDKHAPFRQRKGKIFMRRGLLTSRLGREGPVIFSNGKR